MFLLAGPLLGYAFGTWLDRHGGTDPWGKTFATGLGFIAGVRQTIRAIRQFQHDVTEEPSNHGHD